ncbi:MAG TPA: hypothetical protein VLZ12_12590 [Verrucomicrobiae bacterium]|nr:hypothetical protein [Verrucomicrobiae bacterium]
MNLVNHNSLGATLDAVTEAFFLDRKLSPAQRTRVAKWIASRQGLPGSYANMFAPTARDFRTGYRVFTGEKVTSRAATAHILGEEACRALSLLDVLVAEARVARRRAAEGMQARLGRSNSGTYCCGTCSVSLWRNLAAGGLPNAKRRLLAGLNALRRNRLGNGRWRRFPFFYTLLALEELGLPAALAELRYAAPACERCLKRTANGSPFTNRRRLLLQRVLEKCG